MVEQSVEGLAIAAKNPPFLVEKSLRESLPATARGKGASPLTQ